MVQKLKNKWKQHLSENNMSYWDHFVFAFGYGIKCIRAGFYLIVHSMLPCFFAHAGSRLVRKMEKVFTEREDEFKSIIEKQDDKRIDL